MNKLNLSKLVFAALFVSTASVAQEFNEKDPSTWNEYHNMAAKLAYCLKVVEEACPENSSGKQKSPFADLADTLSGLSARSNKCPYFTDKLYLADKVFFEGLRELDPTLDSQSKSIQLTIYEEVKRAKIMDQLNIPVSEYDKCQRDVEEFLAKSYKPAFDLNTLND